MKSFFLLSLAVAFCAFPLLSFGDVVLIDFTDFTADPASAVSAVSYGPGTNSVTISEDPDYVSIWLYNDALNVPTGSTTIWFDYDFVETAGGNDELYAWLYDPVTFALYNSYEVFIDSTSSGKVTWDITGESFVGGTVGMEFQLNSLPFPNDLTTDSWVTITAPIPEASTLILFGSGGLSLLGLYRPWRRRR